MFGRCSTRFGGSQRIQLAVTASLEHFTAILARSLLSVPAALEGAHPELAALWRWHAAEESEHKAVAYDVYCAAGGYYAERVVVMLATTVIFLAKMTEHTLRLMRIDRIWTSLREWGGLFGYLFASGGTRQLIADYFAWYRPRFHPHDLDTRALLDAWKRDQARAYEVLHVHRPGALAQPRSLQLRAENRLLRGVASANDGASGCGGASGCALRFGRAGFQMRQRKCRRQKRVRGEGGGWGRRNSCLMDQSTRLFPLAGQSNRTRA